MINIVDDIINRYSDEDIIEYLEKQARDIKRAYNTVVEDEEEWVGSLVAMTGKVEMVSNILTAMKKRNENRAAMRES